MSAGENKAAALRMLKEAWSQGNLDVIDELVGAAEKVIAMYGAARET
ncbi:MAG: hypothetical protein JXC32_19785 [Anaerolineae bacterium]|nr:hypothetical protein [Anaerolineae bacterium]